MVRSQELLTYVVYDIPDDRTRLRIAGICKDYGLNHFQYSAFCGYLDGTRRSDLFAKLSGTLGNDRGKIIVVPVCEKDVQMKRIVVNGD